MTNMAGKYDKNADTSFTNPGPQSYNYDPNMSLKKQPRVLIGAARKVSCLVPREKSPGPQCYNPKRLLWKKRASAVTFNRELRKGVGKNGERFTSPGPGSYMIPCKFYDKPQY
jgi:hypothetical protein